MTEKKEAKRVGRPSKADLDANTNGKRVKVGRPPGVAAALKEYTAMMVTSPKSRKVLQKILDAATDDTHKNQAAAWKIVADRIVPVSMFDVSDAKKPSGISITINTVDAQEVNIAPEAEYEEIDDDV